MGEACSKCCNPNTNEFTNEPTGYAHKKEYPKQYPDEKKYAKAKDQPPANPIEDHTNILKKVHR